MLLEEENMYKKDVNKYVVYEWIVKIVMKLNISGLGFVFEGLGNLVGL